MIYVSEIKQTAPAVYKTTLQQNVYQALGIPRVSFAPAEKMETMLGTKIGAATVFGMLLDTAAIVKVIFDKEVLNEEYYGCSDGTTTGYMKIKTELITTKFLPYVKHEAIVIEVQNEFIS